MNTCCCTSERRVTTERNHSRIEVLRQSKTSLVLNYHHNLILIARTLVTLKIRKLCWLLKIWSVESTSAIWKLWKINFFAERNGRKLGAQRSSEIVNLKRKLVCFIWTSRRPVQCFKRARIWWGTNYKLEYIWLSPVMEALALQIILHKTEWLFKLSNFTVFISWSSFIKFG